MVETEENGIRVIKKNFEASCVSRYSISANRDIACNSSDTTN